MISEAGAEPSILRYIDREYATSLMDGMDAQAIVPITHTHSTFDINLLTFLVVHLKGNTTPCACH